ncbi:MAG: HEAT repeat domain-containing protein [Elusimicrobia bacterium]|nr:HEAT repeat domain-containing protein [Elusimicrobiota bacterium]
MKKVFCLLVLSGFAFAQTGLKEQFLMLQSTSVAKRRMAAMQLGRMRNPASVEELMKVLEKDSDFGVRAQAAESLGNLRNRKATPALIKALGDKNRNVRAAVIVAFGYLRDKSAVEPLMNYYKSEDDLGLRISALNVLGVLGDEKALPLMIESLKDKNSRIRTIAAQALGRLRNPKATKPLLEATRDSDKNVRLYAVRSLGEVGNKEVVKDLEKLIEKEKNNSVKIEFARSLGRLGSAAGFGVALEAAKSSDKNIKKSGIRALAAIGKVTDEVKNIILEAYKSKDRVMKREAQLAASLLKIKLPKPEKKKAPAKKGKKPGSK